MFLRQTLSYLPAHPGNAFFLFRKNTPFDKHTEQKEDLKADDDAAADFNRIRCPLCRWQPKATSLWYCTDAGYPHYFYNGCGTAWNTFDTRGQCPGCGHRWKWTDCLRCYGSSPHEKWYVNKTD